MNAHRSPVSAAHTCLLFALLSACSGSVDVVSMPDAHAVDASVAPVDAAAERMDGPPPTCTLLTCPGCCYGDTCQPGNTNVACGKGAAQCFSCGPSDTCLPDQTCGTSADKQWILTIVGATISGQEADGSCWDVPCGAPDPYITINAVKASATVEDSYAPSFNVSLVATTTQLKNGAGLIAMYDEDLVTDDLIASARELQFSDAEIRAGGSVWKNWGQALSTNFTIVAK